MNNEPVAWMSPDGKASDTEGELFYIPLYTHPVKELTDEEFDKIFANGKRLGVLETEDRFRKAMNLTDEEILQEWFYKPAEHELWEVKEVLNFARAILRKAQEK